LVARYNPIAIGAPYSQARLLEFQSALQNTPYFSSVIVDVQRDANAPRDVPVDVQVTEARTQHVGLGLGASTNYGPRVQASYRHNNLFDRAWGLDVGVRTDNLRGSGYADVLLPVRANGAKDSIGVLREHTDIQGLATHRVAFGANRDQVRGLFDSLYRRHPVGGLLVWATDSKTADHRGDGPLAAGVATGSGNDSQFCDIGKPTVEVRGTCDGLV
jgi:translocation and assembly module TamA